MIEEIGDRVRLAVAHVMGEALPEPVAVQIVESVVPDMQVLSEVEVQSEPTLFALEGSESTAVVEEGVEKAVSAELADDAVPVQIESAEMAMDTVPTAVQKDSLPDLGGLVLVQTSQSALQAAVAYEPPQIVKGLRRSEVKTVQEETLLSGPLEQVETRNIDAE